MDMATTTPPSGDCLLSVKATLLPICRMQERLRLDRSDSDTSYLYSLLYAGEMVAKLIVLGLLAGLRKDRDHQQYRQAYQLARADSLGEWSRIADNVLTGPPSAHFQPSARVEQKEMIDRVAAGSWQFDAAASLKLCLDALSVRSDAIGARVGGRQWLQLFAALRNATRGHGAILASKCGEIAPYLSDSIGLVVENFSLFRREWAYLHRCLSGKYRVVDVAERSQLFNYLKSSPHYALRDGVYVFFDEPSQVQLMSSDVDLRDFFFANGAFGNTSFEMLSYITDNRTAAPSQEYLRTATELPQSETSGMARLENVGRALSNIPPRPTPYVRRPALERQLGERLSNDHQPIITLGGRGGIGKTSLALTALHEIAQTERFFAILWFSARDIDLLPTGPKLVTPAVVSEDDIALMYHRLTGPDGRTPPIADLKRTLQSDLTRSAVGPLLLVFDNFETMTNPVETFNWIEAHVRPPNKVLITARHYRFTGDYRIDVQGMSQEECDELIDRYSESLRITGHVTYKFREALYRESDGHPYIIKMLLSEAAKKGVFNSVQRIIADKADLLDALFERTYSELTPAAQRVFLTMCSWRSAIPRLALEAVLLRTATDERLDVKAAVEELVQSSLVEISDASSETEEFLIVPVTALFFGESKLRVTTLRAVIQADTELLQLFGAAQRADFKQGIEPRLNRLFQNAANRASVSTPEQFARLRDVLEYVAHHYPPAWTLLMRWYLEAGDAKNARAVVERFIETGPDDEPRADAWRQYASLSRRLAEPRAEIHGFVQLARCHV